MANDTGKQAAARAAAALITNHMVVGLGTGTTASYFIQALAERVRAEGLTLRGVPTSRAAEALARNSGIPVVALTRETRPDLTVDGADEVDPAFNLIKGGGGALVQEKLVAVSSRQMVVVADAGKAVPHLGAFPLPVAVVPFGWETTLERIEQRFGVPATLRRGDEDKPVVTDDGLYLIDLSFGPINDPRELERQMKRIVGVAEVGLFVGIARRVLFGRADGQVDDVRV